MAYLGIIIHPQKHWSSYCPKKVDKTKDTRLVDHLQRSQAPHSSRAYFNYVDLLYFFYRIKDTLWLPKTLQYRVFQTKIELETPVRSYYLYIIQRRIMTSKLCWRTPFFQKPKLLILITKSVLYLYRGFEAEDHKSYAFMRKFFFNISSTWLSKTFYNFGIFQCNFSPLKSTKSLLLNYTA